MLNLEIPAFFIHFFLKLEAFVYHFTLKIDAVLVILHPNELSPVSCFVDFTDFNLVGF